LADYPAIEISFRDPDDAWLQNRLYALLDDFQPVAIHDDDLNSAWRVFFHTQALRDAALGALGGEPELSARPIDVPDEDWARRSQEGLRAIEAAGLIIAPPWDVPKGATPVIIIEPSMGFGTGHHPTTRLCLRMMRRLELRGARVLDVGTGSGVLALAAWKLGAGDVAGVDNDPDALENARGNIERNGAGPSIDIIQDDLRTLRVQRADVVIANLTGAVLVRYAAELAGLPTDGGYLIVSGFAPQDAAVVRAAFKSLAIIAEETEGDWAALTLRVSAV
jgi:ribosomal protein L11 methyltransferase